METVVQCHHSTDSSTTCRFRYREFSPCDRIAQSEVVLTIFIPFVMNLGYHVVWVNMMQEENKGKIAVCSRR